MKTNRLILFAIFSFSIIFAGKNQIITPAEIFDLERQRVLTAADEYLQEEPVTITAFPATRSAGGRHDYFSEGDYWWPNPEDTDGPYIRRDGMSNPDNFNAHREALLKMSVQVATLTGAYRISGEEKYAKAAIRHLQAWFIAENTRMNPHLKFAQAIKGRVTGRGVGIIDTIHLIEVVKSIEVLQSAGLISETDEQALQNWFSEYLKWLTTHEYGIDERERKNNHGTCWVMQVGAFAKFTGDTALLSYCRERFKQVLLPVQMAPDGSFPLELARTKPYGYSLFNLDAMATVCEILSIPEDNLWHFSLPDRRSMSRAMEFMVPFIEDKSKWPYPADVMYFNEWPVRQPALLFAGRALNRPEYIQLWKELKPEPSTFEGWRNLPVRQPVLWIN